MMSKYNNLNGFKSKIKTIEDTIYKLQVSRIGEFLSKYLARYYWHIALFIFIIDTI